MKREIVNVNFIAAIQQKVPNKTKLANLLVEILQIEKEAVYRRLRGEVSFTFAEVAILSDKLGISLDELLGIQSERRRPFSLQINDFDIPTDTDYIMWENYIHVLDIFKGQPDFAIYETWDSIPFPLCYKFPALLQFYIFKWAYRVRNEAVLKRFDDIKVDKKMVVMGEENLVACMNASETQWILNEDIFLRLVKDIKFFSRIRTMSEGNVKAVKNDLIHFLDYLEDLTFYGEYKETGKKVSIYLADINIDTLYSLVGAKGNYISMLRTLSLSYAATTDQTTYLYMKNWFDSLKRLSVLISVSGEKERTRFFSEQRNLINSL